MKKEAYGHEVSFRNIPRASKHKQISAFNFLSKRNVVWKRKMSKKFTQNASFLDPKDYAERTRRAVQFEMGPWAPNHLKN